MAERELVSGVYRAYDEKSGASFVGFSHNFAGTRKRLRFELTLNACSNKALQAFWNECGTLSFELLEEYAPDAYATELEAEAHLNARLFLWKERLGPQTRLIQTVI